MAEPTRVAGGTPEIVRRRRDNIHRNAVQWNVLGLPGAGDSISSAGGGGCLLSGAIAGNKPGLGPGRGGEASGGARGGDAGDCGASGGSVLIPLEGLVKKWPGRAQQITELAGLIGEVNGRRAFPLGRGGARG